MFAICGIKWRLQVKSWTRRPWTKSVHQHLRKLTQEASIPEHWRVYSTSQPKSVTNRIIRQNMGENFRGKWVLRQTLIYSKNLIKHELPAKFNNVIYGVLIPQRTYGLFIRKKLSWKVPFNQRFRSKISRRKVAVVQFTPRERPLFYLNFVRDVTKTTFDGLNTKQKWQKSCFFKSFSRKISTETAPTETKKIQQNIERNNCYFAPHWNYGK